MNAPLRSFLSVAIAIAAILSGCGGSGSDDGPIPPPSTNAQELSLDSPAGQRRPDVAFDSEGNAVAVWVEMIGDTGRVLWSRYTAASSTWSEAEEWTTHTSTPVHASVASNGTGFLVAWSVGCGIDATLSEGEGWAAPVRLANACSNDEIAVASDGRGYAVAWWQHLWGQPTVLASVHDGTSWQDDYTAGTPSTPVSSGESDQVSSVVLAGSEAGYAVAWVERASSSHALHVNVFEGGAWQVDGLGEPSPTQLGSSRWVPTPAIASDGAGYAVVWIQRDDDSQDDVFGSVRSGSSWTAPVLLEQEATPAMPPPAVASNGSGYVAVWRHWDGSAAALRTNMFTDGGWQADSTLVASDVSEDFDPGIVANGRGYLAAWLGRSGPRAAYSSSLGSTWGAPERIDGGSGDVWSVRLAPSPLGPAAIFPQDDASGANRMFVSRLVIEGWGTPKDLLAGPTRSAARFARLATNRLGETLALWTQYRNGVPEVAGRLHRDGAWQPVEVIAPRATEAVMATNGSGFLVAWESSDDGALRARRWADGFWSEEERLSSPPASVGHPAVASDGRGYAVVWMDYTSGTWTIAMARFDGSSWEDDGAGNILVDRVDVEGNAQNPAVASNGKGWCVGWSSFDGGGALARVHDGSSWQASPARLGAAVPGNAVVLASNGRGYAAAWSQFEGDEEVWEVYANVFDGASWQEEGGAPAPTLLEELAGSAGDPVIASDGRGYAVSWVQRLDAGTSSARVNVFDGATWQTDGGHPAPTPLEAAPISMNGIAIASDGIGYAIAWSESVPEKLLLSRYDGTSWSASAVQTSDDFGAFPGCLTSNGRGYSLVWQQQDEPGQWETPEIWAQLGM